MKKPFIFVPIFWISVISFLLLSGLPVNRHTAPFLLYVDIKQGDYIDGPKYNFSRVWSEVGYYKRFYASAFGSFWQRTEWIYNSCVSEKNIEKVKKEQREKLKEEFETAKKNFDNGFGRIRW